MVNGTSLQIHIINLTIPRTNFHKGLLLSKFYLSPKLRQGVARRDRHINLIGGTAFPVPSTCFAIAENGLTCRRTSIWVSSMKCRPGKRSKNIPP